MIKVTAGNKYMDIDAYASCIVYAEFLNSIGKTAKAIQTSQNINRSVPPSLFNMKYKLNKFTIEPTDNFIILDVSNPNMIDENILKGKIIQVIDHHPYYEFLNYWKEKETSVTLDEIGSVCTIIYETIKKNNKLNILDSNLCKLLLAGILDNTLNLKANITTQRDINAYKEIMKLGKIEKNFSHDYFLECQKSYEENILETIENDLKTNLEFSLLPKIFGQLLVIDFKSIFSKKDIIINYMNNNYTNWMINFINLEDGKSYILTDSKETTKSINSFLNGKIDINGVIILSSFKLRKEILKLSLDKKIV